MRTDALTVLENLGGFATTEQLLKVMTRQQLDVQVKTGGLVRVWYGVYAAEQPNLLGRLAALDIFMGRHAVACMGTAAALHGFDTENNTAIHVLDPGVRMRPTVGLMVHQRTGAPATTRIRASRNCTGMDSRGGGKAIGETTSTGNARRSIAFDAMHPQ